MRHLRAAAAGGCGGLEPGAATAPAGGGGGAGAAGSAPAGGATPTGTAADGKVGRAESRVKDAFATSPSPGGKPSSPRASVVRWVDESRTPLLVLLIVAFVGGFAVVWTHQLRRGRGTRPA